MTFFYACIYTNHTTIEAYGNHTNGNCKKVYIVELDLACTSMTDAAEVIGCSLDAVSNTIRGTQRTCKGFHIIDLSKAGEAFPQMVSCLSEVNTSRRKAKASKMDMTPEDVKEFRKWKAEKVAKQKAEEKARKFEAKKVKLMADVERHKVLAEKAFAKADAELKKQVKAEQKLEALMDKEVK